ncbi:hypothetical protein [Streptomyces sp. Ag109_O5-1]|uniref:hypothetical protein n=1 Tax=Streptomyces sp. Ag109_O5-1 TaxID=1938851 RepID=UPI00288B909A|nr:hypothetical protein [Streptomyces sp. Ag109_O5-1]
MNGTPQDDSRIRGGVDLDGGRVGSVGREGTPSSAPRSAPQTGAVTVDGQRPTANPDLPWHPAVTRGSRP